MRDAPMLVAKVDTGDTAWMLVATALVLLMTPALGLFYAGLVRSKNTLNTFMMCIAAIAVATVTWALVGYSLAFDEGNGPHRRLRLRVPAGRRPSSRARDRRSRTSSSSPSRRPSASSPTALVSGAVVERMRFGAFLVFAALWSVLVYAVLAHWGFGGGWLIEGGTLDFAGGIAVEMASGFSALAAALVVGARKDYGRQALLPAQRRLRAARRRPAVVRLVRLQRRQRLQHRPELERARVHQHAADARPARCSSGSRSTDPRPPGDGDRRRDRDHRRLRRDHAGGRLRQPGLGDGCSARSSRSRATR